MITEYNRPDTVDSALELLARKSPQTYILAGGTNLILRKSEDFAVVDIQELSLNTIQAETGRIQIGACVTLQQMVDSPELPEVIRSAAKAEASFNIRQSATIGGTIASGNGQSPLLNVLLAANAEISLARQNKSVLLGEIIPLRSEALSKQLITEVTILTNLQIVTEKISKTPDDVPLLLISIAQWSGGRTRVVVGGPFPYPKVSMDGTSATGADVSASNLFSGTNAYLCEMAGILVKRCLQKLQNGGSNEH